MKLKIKLAAIAKNEAAYIPQWVFHHLAAGFDCLEFWINGTTDNSLAILDELSKKNPGQISVHLADDLLQESKIREVNFQIEAYSKIYNQTKEAGDFTHIMFLDLDEYWMSVENTDIKTFIQNAPDFDSISFQWFIDIPEYTRTPFESIFKTTTVLQKDRHVKSLLKISDKPTKVLIHNSKISNGNFYLANGSEFEEFDPEQEHRQKVSKPYFDETKRRLDNHFILHLVYKSQTEYLASLTRGRVHVNDTNIFKVNRFGYSPYVNDDQLELHLTPEHLEQTDKLFKLFLDSNNLSDLLNEARRFVYARCNQALDTIAQNPEVKSSYAQQLRGLQLDVLENARQVSKSPLYHIDVVKLIGDTVIIKGWVWDPLNSEKIRLDVETSNDYSISVESNNRPDVQTVHPDANIDCGFSISIKVSNDDLSRIAHQDPTFKIYAQNKYFRNELRTNKPIVRI